MFYSFLTISMISSRQSLFIIYSIWYNKHILTLQLIEMQYSFAFVENVFEVYAASLKKMKTYTNMIYIPLHIFAWHFIALVCE